MIDPQIPISYLAAGLSVLPAIKARKFPCVGSWKQYQTRLPTELEVRTWFANDHDALCIVCGRVSGNLEIIDFDCHGELFPAWRDAVSPELFSKLVVENTPSGGLHVAYRTEAEVGGNLKLAQGNRNGKLTTLIETRAEGGLFLCAPSDGYSLVQNNFTEVPTLSADERENLLAAAWALNEHTTSSSVESGPVEEDDPQFEIRPGDDFAARGDLKALLVKHGWTPLYCRDENEYFRRPGKTDDGVSASYNGKTFYVFSTNAQPFEPAVGYSAFQVYALLEHGGDYSQAASSLLAQGYGKRREVAEVDISGLLSKCSVELPQPKKDEAEELFPNPGDFPEPLLEIPGLLDEYMRLSLDSAPYPNRLLSLGAGLTFVSMLCGRLYADRRGVHPNLFWISLAPSGVGKEHNRQLIKILAMQTGYMPNIGDGFASGEGLEDAMYRYGKKLYQLDEVDTLFNTLNQKDSRTEGIIEKLLRFYSSVSTSYIMRTKAVQRKSGEGEQPDAGIIPYPFLVLHATAIPQLFYESLTARVLQNGLIPRMMILDVGKRGHHGDPKMIVPGEKLLGMIRAFKDKSARGGNLVNENPVIQVVDESPEATEMLRSINSDCDDKYDFFSDRGELAAQALWARAYEKVCKLSLIYAASVCPAAPKITPEAVAWAASMVFYLTSRTLYMADRYLFEDLFDKKCKKVIRFIQEDGRVVHSKLLRRCHESSENFRKIIATLIENGQITREIDTSTNPPSTYYRLA